MEAGCWALEAAIGGRGDPHGSPEARPGPCHWELPQGCDLAGMWLLEMEGSVQHSAGLGEAFRWQHQVEF